MTEDGQMGIAGTCRNMRCRGMFKLFLQVFCRRSRPASLPVTLRLRMIGCLLVLSVCFRLGAAESRKDQYSDEMVRQMIGTLTRTLLDRQSPEGAWEYPGHPVGCTALVLLALTQAEFPISGPAIRKAKSFLVGKDSSKTYGEALLLCALEPWADEGDVRRRMETAAEHLVEWQTRSGGWTYGDGSAGEYYDFSNTQFAILGLGAAERVGISGSEKAFPRAKQLWLSTQNRDGGWGYRGGDESYASMTCAGIASLHLMGERLEKPTRKCGNYTFDPVLCNSLSLVRNYILKNEIYGQHHANELYAWYALERVAIFLDVKAFGDVDWYPAGIPVVMRCLNVDTPVSDTAFGLLFLAKAALPLAICKWKWCGDWNNDHADAREWVELASRQLKKKLDWLPARIDEPRTPAAKASLIFLNGHSRFTLRKGEAEFLRRFLKDGGTVVAEPCCNSPVFADSFRDEIVRNLYPGNLGHFRKISEDHPIYSAHYPLKPRIPIYQLSRSGCRKTRVFMLGGDISCALNGEPVSREHAEYAGKLAVNLLAFAIALRVPKGKLDQAELPSDEPPETVSITADEIRRHWSSRGVDCAHPFGRLKHQGDWHADPALFVHLQEVSKAYDTVPEFDAEVPVDPESADLFNIPVLFMNGHDDPEFSDEAVVNLRLYLQNGGFLFASACCSSEKFHRGFLHAIKKILPNDTLERIPETDLLFRSPCPLNALPAKGNGPYTQLYQDRWAELWGIRREGRWLVIYSAVDMCCGMEGDVGEDVPAYKPESSARLLLNILAESVRID